MTDIPVKLPEAVTDELRKVKDFVDSVVNHMEKAQLKAGTHNPVVLKMLREGLQASLTGIFLAHLTQSSTLDVEDTIMNVFCISMMAYYKRRYDTKGGTDPVIENAQSVINEVSKMLSAEIATYFKRDMPVPVSRKRH